MSSEGNLIVISAPSGSGKTSLANRAVEELPGLTFSVSHTTRAPRPGERHGVEYFFVDPPEFEAMIKRDEFLEYAHVYGNYYGTTRAFVDRELAAGQDVLLDIDVQGAIKIARQRPECVMVFVFPPDFRELEQRLRGRGLDDDAIIRRRLEMATREIESYRRYHYAIINQDFEESLDELKSIIVAARCRLAKRRARVEQIVETFKETQK